MRKRSGFADENRSLTGASLSAGAARFVTTFLIHSLSPNGRAAWGDYRTSRDASQAECGSTGRHGCVIRLRRSVGHFSEHRAQARWHGGGRTGKRDQSPTLRFAKNGAPATDGTDGSTASQWRSTINATWTITRTGTVARGCPILFGEKGGGRTGKRDQSPTLRFAKNGAPAGACGSDSAYPSRRKCHGPSSRQAN